MSDYSISMLSDFEEAEWEIETKGWFSGSKLSAGGKIYQLCFYDPVRLSQTIEDDLRSGRVFFEKNLIIVESVTRANMEKAVEWLVTSGQLSSLSPE